MFGQITCSHCGVSQRFFSKANLNETFAINSLEVGSENDYVDRTRELEELFGEGLYESARSSAKRFLGYFPNDLNGIRLLILSDFHLNALRRGMPFYFDFVSDLYPSLDSEGKNFIYFNIIKLELLKFLIRDLEIEDLSVHAMMQLLLKIAKVLDDDHLHDFVWWLSNANPSPPKESDDEEDYSENAMGFYQHCNYGTVLSWYCATPTSTCYLSPTLSKVPNSYFLRPNITDKHLASLAKLKGYFDRTGIPWDDLYLYRGNPEGPLEAIHLVDRYGLFMEPPVAPPEPPAESEVGCLIQVGLMVLLLVSIPTVITAVATKGSDWFTKVLCFVIAAIFTGIVAQMFGKFHR
jgi:hypothetical protein